MTGGRHIIYARGFPYGAPLVFIRGGATRDDDVKAFLRSQGFHFSMEDHGWKHYLHRDDLALVLVTLRDRFGCDVVAKGDLDPGYIIEDLDAAARGSVIKTGMEIFDGVPADEREQLALHIVAQGDEAGFTDQQIAAARTVLADLDRANIAFLLGEAAGFAKKAGLDADAFAAAASKAYEEARA